MMTHSIKNTVTESKLALSFIRATSVIVSLSLLLLVSTALTSVVAKAEPSHPMLMQDQQDIALMRQAITVDGSFKDAFKRVKASVDAQLLMPVTVPTPKDAGGGYTHEKHKKNYSLMYQAGIIYQLTGDKQYASYVRDMLLAYAKMYPTLPLHPQKKELSPGKLFWQSLNETVWLVYAIQGYDNIISSLTEQEQQTIEQGVFYPMVKYLSVDLAHKFNQVHNHGTWATAGVGMAGYVLNEPEWVEQALLGLDKSGTGGFIKQLDKLFSPDGYYTEGPYYQRYALLPFVSFAKAIEENEPERKIFEYRDQVLLKAINNTIQLSYNKLFFPINDAIKDKGIDTIELVHGVATAYGLTGDTGLLSIAIEQDNILLTADGLKVAKAIDANKATPFMFDSMAVGDGASGDEGALVIMRANQATSHQALVFKATAQGMGHGHFDKLNWLFYDNGQEIIRDYGAARFLNVEAKYGGHYLKENNTYAKQTIAHNTLVVDETSHFNGKVKTANQHHPVLNFFAKTEQATVSQASINTAYKDANITRTQALINTNAIERPLVIDVVSVEANASHQYDLPVHYNGHLIDTNFALMSNNTSLPRLGEANGYQHLWLKSQGKPSEKLAKITWLNAGRFYTHSTLSSSPLDVLFTQVGATDPDFNLRPENGFVLRIPKGKNEMLVNVLELHGEYNPSKEFTVNSHSQVSDITLQQQAQVAVVEVSFVNNSKVALAFVTDNSEQQEKSFTYQGKSYEISHSFMVIEASKLAQ